MYLEIQNNLSLLSKPLCCIAVTHRFAQQQVTFLRSVPCLMRLCKTNVKVPGYGEGLVPLSTQELREPCFPMESMSIPRNIHISPRQRPCLCWSYLLRNILIPPTTKYWMLAWDFWSKIRYSTGIYSPLRIKWDDMGDALFYFPGKKDI